MISHSPFKPFVLEDPVKSGSVYHFEFVAFSVYMVLEVGNHSCPIQSSMPCSTFTRRDGSIASAFPVVQPKSVFISFNINTSASISVFQKDQSVLEFQYDPKPNSSGY